MTSTRLADSPIVRPFCRLVQDGCGLCLFISARLNHHHISASVEKTPSVIKSFSRARYPVRPEFRGGYVLEPKHGFQATSDGGANGGSALMWELCRRSADWKSPPHCSSTPQLWHSEKKIFFQSEMDFRAN